MYVYPWVISLASSLLEVDVVNSLEVSVRLQKSFIEESEELFHH